MCFGNNDVGECGDGTRLQYLLGPPSVIPFFNLVSNPVRQVIALSLVTCVLLEVSGQVTCWGFGAGALLGRGSTTNVFPLTASSPIVFDQPTITVTQISGVNMHVCALFTNQRVKCWGRNFFGQVYVSPLSYVSP